MLTIAQDRIAKKTPPPVRLMKGQLQRFAPRLPGGVACFPEPTAGGEAIIYLL